MSEIDAQIAAANSRLKAQKIGISIERDGNKLCLRGTLPPKPNAKNQVPTRQRIYTGIAATKVGVTQAEKQAIKIRIAIDENKFNWAYYGSVEHNSPPNSPSNAGEWISLFQADYFNRRRRSQQTETTWKTDYESVYRQIDPNLVLTYALIQSTILKTQPDTKSRKRFCLALGALAKFAKIEFNTRPFVGNYNPRKVAPRDIPEDDLIVECFEAITSPCWRWVFGVLACYGLRNHEAFRLDYAYFLQGNVCSVLSGKTGARRVWPFHPQWFKRFELAQVNLPRINTTRSNASIGHEVTQFFYRHQLPFKPYDLRHAWAVRTLEYGLDVSLAAQQMGHSLKVHSDLYHHWISDRQHQRAFDLLMQNQNLPQPPN